MTMVPQNDEYTIERNSALKKFLSCFHVSKLLLRCGAFKEKGISVIQIRNCVAQSGFSAWQHALADAQRQVYRRLRHESGKALVIGEVLQKQEQLYSRPRGKTTHCLSRILTCSLGVREFRS